MLLLFLNKEKMKTPNQVFLFETKNLNNIELTLTEWQLLQHWPYLPSFLGSLVVVTANRIDQLCLAEDL